MSDRHRNLPIALRLPEGDRSWLKQHAAETGQAVNAIIARLVAEYRKRHQEGELRSGCYGTTVPA